MSGDDIVVTGTGVCCNLGDDLSEIELMLRQGRGVPFVHYEDAAAVHTACQLLGRYHGDVTDAAIGITKAEGRFFGRAARMSLKAARVAIEGSGIDATEAAVVVGTGTGDVQTHIAMQRRLDTRGKSRGVGPTTIPRLMASTASANLATVLRTRGPSFSATAACAGGAYNILLAAQLVRDGFAPAAIAGGVECEDIHFHVGFDEMRAYNLKDNDQPERASRPYAADRAGFVFGEGAGIVVLEKRADAERRRAAVLGSLRGWGLTSDADGNMVKPSVDGPFRAMRGALSHAGVRPEAIGYVNTHGTSTPAGDVNEVRAIREAFGTHRPAYSSTKGYTGHTISGAGAIEAIFTLAMLRGGWLAPSINAEPVDEELSDYPPVTKPTDAPVDLALSNSFGFGGTNATLVLGRD